MIKNNIKINKEVKNQTKKKINTILKKIIKNSTLKILIKLQNIKLNTTGISSLQKKCLYTNKHKTLFKNLNISRWHLENKKLKLSIRKW